MQKKKNQLSFKYLHLIFCFEYLSLRKMSLNKTMRKRSLPEWMKSPSQSSFVSKGKLSPHRKAQGPSYPPISVKKIKKVPKLLEGSLTQADEQDTCSLAGISIENKEGNLNVNPTLEITDQSSKSIHHSPSEEKESEIDDLFLTVEDLTRMAQEVINEELQKQLSFKNKSKRL